MVTDVERSLVDEDEYERFILIENDTSGVDYCDRPDRAKLWLLDWPGAEIQIPWNAGDSPKDAILKWAEHQAVEFRPLVRENAGTVATEAEIVAHIHTYNRPVGSPCKTEGCTKTREKPFKGRK